MDEADKDLFEGCLHVLAAHLSWWMYDTNRSLPRFLNTNYALDSVKVEISYKIRKVIEPTEEDLMVATFSYQNPMTKEMVEKRVFILCFRGTRSASDWLTNLGATPNKQAFKDCGLHVHSGWLSLVHCDNLIEMCLKALRVENQSPLESPVDSVLICGHSMGGALAQITATLAYSYANTWRNSLPKQPSEQEQRIHGLLTEAMRCLLTEKLFCVTLAAPQPFANPSSEELEKWTPLQKAASEKTLEWMEGHLVNYVNGNDLVPRVPGNMDFVIGMLKNLPWMQVSNLFAPGLYAFQAADLAQQWKESCQQLKLYRPVGQTVYIGHTSQSDLETPIPKDPEVVKISNRAWWYDAYAACHDHQVTTYADRIHLKKGVRTHLFGYQHGLWKTPSLGLPRQLGSFLELSEKKYEGIWAPDGYFRHGVKVFPDGTRQEGTFGPLECLRHGVVAFPSGTRHEGDFGPYDGPLGPEGLKSGLKVYPDGTRQEGTWGPDEKFRHGVVTFPNGTRMEVYPDGTRSRLEGA